MSIVQAYKSDEDGVLFEDKKEYLNHLRKLARKKSDQKKKQKILDDFNQKISEMLSTCITDKDINQFLENNKNVFIGNPYHFESKNLKKIDYKMQIQDLKFYEEIANTHCAPLGKPHNFRQTSDLPKNYPGWRGIIFVEDGNDFHYESYWLHKTGINTGSGGSCGKRNLLRYELTLFAHDFKTMFMQEFIDEIHCGNISKKLAYDKAVIFIKYPELMQDQHEFIDQMKNFLPILKEMDKNGEYLPDFDQFIIQFEKLNLEYKLNETDRKILQHSKKSKI